MALKIFALFMCVSFGSSSFSAPDQPSPQPQQVKNMKTIGLLGGTGWSSTIGYYTLLNEEVNAQLGGHHSAKILLKSIDYHDILSSYGKDHAKVAQLLKEELKGLLALNPDGFIICCNSLHKYFDLIKDDLNLKIPVFHALELMAQHCVDKGYKRVLLLATQFTMEDGFFAQKLEEHGITVIIPDLPQRNEMHRIHNEELMQNIVTPEAKKYFQDLISQHKDVDAVIVGCTEYPLVFTQENSPLPLINPVVLQGKAAVAFALAEAPPKSHR